MYSVLTWKTRYWSSFNKDSLWKSINYNYSSTLKLELKNKWLQPKQHLFTPLQVLFRLEYRNLARLVLNRGSSEINTQTLLDPRSSHCWAQNVLKQLSYLFHTFLLDSLGYNTIAKVCHMNMPTHKYITHFTLTRVTGKFWGHICFKMFPLLWGHIIALKCYHLCEVI